MSPLWGCVLWSPQTQILYCQIKEALQNHSNYIWKCWMWIWVCEYELDREYTLTQMLIAPPKLDHFSRDLDKHLHFGETSCPSLPFFHLSLVLHLPSLLPVTILVIMDNSCYDTLQLVLSSLRPVSDVHQLFAFVCVCACVGEDSLGHVHAWILVACLSPHFIWLIIVAAIRETLVKGVFSDHRLYMDVKGWQRCCRRWQQPSPDKKSLISVLSGPSTDY